VNSFTERFFILMISVVYCGIWCHKRDLNEFKLNYLITTARMLAFIHYTWLRCKIKESNLQCEFVENVIKSEAGKSELKYNPVSFFFYWLLKVCACNSAGVISLYGYFSKSWGGYRIHKECAQNLEITTVLVNFNYIFTVSIHEGPNADHCRVGDSALYTHTMT